MRLSAIVIAMCFSLNLMATSEGLQENDLHFDGQPELLGQGRLLQAGKRLVEEGSIARIYFREGQMNHPSMVSLMDVERSELSLVRFSANNTPAWGNPATAHLFPPLQKLLRGQSTDACYTGSLTAMQWYVEILMEKFQAELLSSTASRNDRTFRLEFIQQGKHYETLIPFCD